MCVYYKFIIGLYQLNSAPSLVRPPHRASDRDMPLERKTPHPGLASHFQSGKATAGNPGARSMQPRAVRLPGRSLAKAARLIVRALILKRVDIPAW